MRVEDMPMVRVTLEGMKTSVVHAFNARQVDIAAAVDRAVSEALAAVNIEAEARRLADEVIRHAITEAVQSAARSIAWNETLRLALHEAATKALKASLESH